MSGPAATLSPLRGRLLVVAAALLWSTGGLAIKLVPLPALGVAFWRSFVSALFLLAVFRPSRASWRHAAPSTVARLRAHDPDVRLRDEDDDGRERDLPAVHGPALRPRARAVPPQGARSGASTPSPSASRSSGCRSSSSAVSTPARSRGISSPCLGCLLRTHDPPPAPRRVGRRDSVRHRGQPPRGGARAAVRVGPSRARREGHRSSSSSSASSSWASATSSS